MLGVAAPLCIRLDQSSEAGPGLDLAMICLLDETGQGQQARNECPRAALVICHEKLASASRHDQPVCFKLSCRA